MRVRDVATAAVGPRSAVASSPDHLQACKWEVEEDMERFVQAAEVLQRTKIMWHVILIIGVERYCSLCLDDLQYAHTSS